MSTILTVLHVIVCLFLMLTVLLQAGKGGGMGAAFGGGSSAGTVFGGSGAGGFLRKLTVSAATIFMLTSMTLAYLASTSNEDSLQKYSAQQKAEAMSRQALELEGSAVTQDAAAVPGDPLGTQAGDAGSATSADSGAAAGEVTPADTSGADDTPTDTGSADTPASPPTPADTPAPEALPGSGGAAPTPPPEPATP